MSASNSGTNATGAAATAVAQALLQSIDEHPVVDTAERQAVYLLIGRNGAYIRLSSSAVQLLRQVSQGISFERLAQALSQRGAKAVSPADVASSFQRVVDRIAAIEAQDHRPRGAFWLRRCLLPGPLVGSIARRCAAAYRPAIAAVLVTAIVAAVVVGRRWGLGVDPAQFWPAYGLLLASLAVHEIGHASACAYYGARPSEIGVALYLVYPVFYSNVSAAWTLRRAQRVIVDLGGVYFQLVIGAAYTFAYALSGWGPLALAVVFIVGSCLFSLNPILKFDGYWVVSDGLGVTNLGSQPFRILRHCAARLRGLRTPPLPWRPSTTVLLVLYSMLSIGFWGWFVWKLAPALSLHALRAVHILTALAADLVSSPAWPDGARIQEGLAALYVLLLAAVMAGRLLRGAGGLIARRIRAHRSVPLPAGDPA